MTKPIEQLELQDESRKAAEWYLQKNYKGVKLDVQEKMRILNASASSFFMGVKWLEKKLRLENNQPKDNQNGTTNRQEQSSDIAP